MSTLSLKLFVFLSIGFVVAIPVLFSVEQRSKTSDSLLSDSSRAIEAVDTFQGGQGDQLFASEQWDKSMTRMPSRVRRSRDPETTIFNHMQWDNSDLDDTSPWSTALIFAHDQWEKPEARDETGQVGDGGHRPDFRDKFRKSAQRSPGTQIISRDQVEIFEHEQWERREGATDLDVAKRKNISTGPIFFAKVQWDE